MFFARPLKGVAQVVSKGPTARSLSASTSSAARPRPRPRPARTTSSLPKVPVEEFLPPMALLKSAKKSGALDVEPDAALSILRNYVELSAQRLKGKWEKEFCVEENITPSTMILLALILDKCKEAPRKTLARDLIFSASSVGEPSATIYLLNHALGKKKVDLPDYVAPLAHLRTLAAPPNSNIDAMVLLGRIYEVRKEEDRALQLYQQAASTIPSVEGERVTILKIPSEGVASALVHQGSILHRRGNKSGAEAAFRKAALEHDYPTGYYRLAGLQGPRSEKQETYLSKAASSGITRAATDLGRLHQARAKLESTENKDQKAMHVKLAKEWLYLGATAGDSKSMLGLAEIFVDQGKIQSAKKWLEMAAKSIDNAVAEMALNTKADLEKVTAR